MVDYTMLFSLIALFLLISCSSQDSSVFSASDVGVALKSEVMTVVSRRVVSLEKKNKKAVEVGAAVGGVTGAIAGAKRGTISSIGSGIVGASIGTLLGSAIASQGKGQAIEYVLKNKHDEMFTVLQKPSVDIAVGTRVIVHTNPQNHHVSIEPMPYLAS